MVPRISLNESSRCIKKRWTAHDHNPVASSALDINTSLQQVRLQRGYYPQTGVVLNPKFETTRCPAPQTYRKLTSFFRKCVNSPTSGFGRSGGLRRQYTRSESPQTGDNPCSLRVSRGVSVRLIDDMSNKFLFDDGRDIGLFRREINLLDGSFDNGIHFARESALAPIQALLREEDRK